MPHNADVTEDSDSPAMQNDQAPADDDEQQTVVLAAVDTSPAAGRVIDLAARLVRRTWPAAHLHVVHVFRWQPFERSRAGVPAEELADEARQYLEYEVRSARRQCARPVTGHFVEGDAEEAIVDLARSLSADLVLVGSHDAPGIKGLLRASVAEKVAKRAPCPVLIVRPKARPYVKVR